METTILRVMDWDVTWIGLGWLRPAKDQPLTGRAALTIAALTSPLVLLAGPVCYLLLEPFVGLGALDAAALVSVLAVLLNVIMQLLSAVYWNQRAAELQAFRHTSG